MKFLQLFLLSIILFTSVIAVAQTSRQDTASKVVVSANTITTSGKDSVRILVDSVEAHSARKATRRSALIPGWGQAYNNEYWKIPIVYGAIGVPAGFFIYNNTWYKRTKKAYEFKIANDTNGIKTIHQKIQGLDAESLRFYRNQFRRDRDYSILYTLIAWGLNVADATVFAHLKDFDVSDDLSLKIKPGYSPNANTSGISLVLAVKNSSHKRIGLFPKSL